MKTKIIYVIVSTPKDTYLEQALISVYSARLHNPTAYIEIVVDNATAENITGKRSKIKKYITEITTIDVPSHYTKGQRSRYLKTNLRNIIDGDYIFIDTDTIICGSLEEADKFEWDICAAKELNIHNTFSKKEPWMYKLAQRVNIEKLLMDEPYFNSGVMYVKDTAIAHRLYTRWHTYWKEYSAQGLCTDQTPLCMANKTEGHPIHHIDDKWNCQIRYNGLYTSKNALIIHYFAGMEECAYIFSKQAIFDIIKETGLIPSYIQSMVHAPNEAFTTDAQTMAYNQDTPYIRYTYENNKVLFHVVQSICHIYTSLSRKMNKVFIK